MNCDAVNCAQGILHGELFRSEMCRSELCHSKLCTVNCQQTHAGTTKYIIMNGIEKLKKLIYTNNYMGISNIFKISKIGDKDWSK
jgi:hypothetical protein